MLSQATKNENVRLRSQSQIPVIPFAVELPTTTLQSFDDEPTPRRKLLSLVGNDAIVGSIVLLGNSAMVWVAWGKLDGISSPPTQSDESGFGKGMFLEASQDRDTY
jgi:hypothetical protein